MPLLESSVGDIFGVETCGDNSLGVIMEQNVDIFRYLSPAAALGTRGLFELAENVIAGLKNWW